MKCKHCGIAISEDEGDNIAQQLCIGCDIDEGFGEDPYEGENFSGQEGGEL